MIRCNAAPYHTQNTHLIQYRNILCHLSRMSSTLLPVALPPVLARRPTRVTFGLHRNRVGHNGIYSVVPVRKMGRRGALTMMVRAALPGSDPGNGPSFAQADHKHMRRALELARRGLGFTHPNPAVGCVIVDPSSGEVLGEGYHPAAGMPHAEVYALRAAGARSKGATAYVTLEPCSHHGRTPPCAEALLAAGVARVVVATLDRNPLVSGNGVRRLRSAGVQVDLGCEEEEAAALNAEFFNRMVAPAPPSDSSMTT